MIIGLLHSDMWAQGYNLKFNRVIDTVISISHTSCTNMYSTPVYGSTIVVPNGVVWKITSLIGTPSSAVCMYSSCSNTSCGTNGYSNFFKLSGNQEFALFSTGGDSQFNLPLWVNAQTSFRWKAWSSSSTREYNRTWDVNNSAHLSIIEFLLVP